jgi:ribosome-binding protein aMBF1 (putative translation factor)
MNTKFSRDLVIKHNSQDLCNICSKPGTHINDMNGNQLYTCNTCFAQFGSKPKYNLIFIISKV